MDDAVAPLRVFIVEDSPVIVDLLRRAVDAAGGTMIGHSDSAADASAMLSLVQPDLIILDIKLKSGTGLDVLRSLQASGHARSAIKIIFSNHAEAQYRELSRQLGADAFFDKSAEGSQALDLIYRLAAERQHARSCSFALDALSSMHTRRLDR